MVEYYEGLLMAVDSLKRTGTSIDLYTYNSRSRKCLAELHPGQKRDEGHGHHLRASVPTAHQTAGRVCQETRHTPGDTIHIERQHGIPESGGLSDKYPQSHLYSEVYDHFVRQFPNANVIFIEASQGAKDKAEFIKGTER